VATKSGQPEPEKAEVVEEMLDALDSVLDRVKVLYEQYFLGIQKQPPTYLHTDVERKIRDITQIQVRNTALRYRFATLQQKFGSYNSYWRRTLRQIENGTYARNLSKIGRQAAKTGADVPEEILAAMPKRMREQVMRDREAALSLAKLRAQQAAEAAPPDDLLTLADEEVDLADLDPSAFVSEAPELAKDVKNANGALLIDESDGDFDMDAFFAKVINEEAPDALPPGPAATWHAPVPAARPAGQTAGSTGAGARHPKPTGMPAPMIPVISPLAAGSASGPVPQASGSSAISAAPLPAQVGDSGSARIPRVGAAVDFERPFAGQRGPNGHGPYGAPTQPMQRPVDVHHAMTQPVPRDAALPREALPTAALARDAILPARELPSLPTREPAQTSALTQPIPRPAPSSAYVPDPLTDTDAGLPVVRIYSPPPKSTGATPVSGVPHTVRPSAPVIPPPLPRAVREGSAPVRAPVPGSRPNVMAASASPPDSAPIARMDRDARVDGRVTPSSGVPTAVIPPLSANRPPPSKGSSLAPSQATRPSPIKPGASSEMSALDVESMAGPFPRIPTPINSAPLRAARGDSGPVRNDAAMRGDSAAMRVAQIPPKPAPPVAPLHAAPPTAPERQPAQPTNLPPGMTRPPRLAPRVAQEMAPLSPTQPPPMRPAPGPSMAPPSYPAPAPAYPAPAHAVAHPAPGVTRPPAPPPRVPPPRAATPAPVREPLPAGVSDADVNALYTKYVQAKQTLGEAAGPNAYNKLLKTIHDQAPKIMEQYKARGVDFSVVVKDNQVVIRAKPKT
jgi:hypothetical protein